jgi:AGCS family alanine or glycine:cation symporter
MLETISTINGAVNGFIWGIPAMICIIGVGLYLSIGTGFIQIRRFAYSIGHTLGKVFEKKEAESGAMTPFQAVCTALAGTVGTGNIAGVAGAIAIGGPGAVFWMWISALLGMCTKFSEVVLAVHFRERNANGDWVGGPMYFIKNGLSKKWHFLAVLFSIFGTVAVFGTGNATQINTIVTAIDSVFINYNLAGENVLPTINLVLGVILAVCVALVLLGGIRRIGSFTEKLVPFMAVFYIILALGVVIMHIGSVPGVFASIFGGAFDPKAFTGGVVGSMFISMRRGVSRGIFSNEAGLGTGSIAHATADTGHPVQQGLFGIFEVFADTILLCTMTALCVILEYGEAARYGGNYMMMTLSAYSASLGDAAAYFLAAAVTCFGVATVLCWSHYGLSAALTFGGGRKTKNAFLLTYCACVALGSVVSSEFAWELADISMAIMIIINLTVICFMWREVRKETDDFLTLRKTK